MNMSKPSAVLAAVLLVAGCGGRECGDKGDSLIVDVNTTKNLNDSGGGPQHVRFQVWAVKDKSMFENASPDALTESESVANFERQGRGKVFISESNWIKPESTRTLIQSVSDPKEYGWVGIAVAFPKPHKALVSIDCEEKQGYKATKEETTKHRVTFTIAKQSVDAGGLR